MPSTAPQAARRATAPRNDWRLLRPRSVGEPAEAPLAVSVVIPAHDCQHELDLSLAALAAQSHPAELIDVIVVDDRSDPPLTLPELRPAQTTVVRTSGGGHGSGRARDIGARQATGDVVLFLDADIIADRYHVEAHARWHEVTDDAVVLGFRDFVDVAGIGATQVHDAVAGGGLDTLLAGRAREPHTWIEQLLEKTDDLQQDREDLWRVVVGASVSTRRALYEEVGGFAHFPRRGIVDTEFGYRCFTAGGLIVPDRAAFSVHQGPRSFASRGAEIARRRAPLIANHIANPRYRTPVRGRQWAVPYLHVVVPAGDAEFGEIRNTVDDVLANDFDDVTVSLVFDPSHADADLFADYWQADGRVRLTHVPPRSGFPSPATMLIPVGVRLSSESLAGLTARLRTWEHGLLSVSVTGLDAPVELWATRALCRVLRGIVVPATEPGAADSPAESQRRERAAGSLAREAARDLFGEEWLAGVDYGLGTAAGASDHHVRDRRPSQ